jgi:general secretion pathway protein B
MSLILDALKRAERERQADPPPPSAPDVIAMPGRAAPAPRPGVRLASVVVFGGGLALAALLLWDAFRTPAPPAPAAVAPPPQQQPPAPPVIKASPAPPAAVPGTEAVASLDDLSDEPELDTTPTPPPAPAAKRHRPVSPSSIATRPMPPPATVAPEEIRPEPAPAAKPSPPPAAAAESPTAVTPAPQPAPTLSAESAPPAEPQAAPPAAPSAAPPVEIPPALTQPAPLRKFREMPPDYRADFPPLRVEIHVYEQAQARRFVMVNGRKYREGERLAEGPSLVEIVPEGMVLEYRGEKVLYTLGR